MSKRIVIVVFLLVCASLGFSQAEKYKETVPLQVLKLYHPDIVSGSRPKIITITRDMIQPLVKQPELGGDAYKFDFDIRDLSATEKNILLGWIRNGQKILLWGDVDIWKYAPLFSAIMEVKGKTDMEVLLSKHSVNNNVDRQKLVFKGKSNSYVYLKKYPIGTEIIAYVKEDVIAGRVPYEKGSIYFVGLGEYWDLGKDKDIWTLNFYQWMLGLEVPGPVKTLF
ncbi:MAG: hypothetical protein PHW62_03595 [Candidatus Ratteibacteria bacterium]|nr:hypothetical protein [Candidatus Ratteibacteria bacterium]